MRGGVLRSPALPPTAHIAANRDALRKTAASAADWRPCKILLGMLRVGIVGAVAASFLVATSSLTPVVGGLRAFAASSAAPGGGALPASRGRDEDDCAIVAVYHSEALDWITDALVLGGDGNGSATCAFGWRVHIHDRSPAASSRAWLNNLTLSAASRARIVITEEPNWGAEATGYARFISVNYEALPRFAYFTHGDPRKHVPDFDAALACLNPAWTTGYAPLNHHYRVLIPYLDNPYQLTADAFVHDLAAALAQEESASGPAGGGFSVAWPPTMTGSKLAFHCCATFVATRAAIRKHPRRLYEIVLQFLMSAEYFVGGIGGGKDHAHFIEPLWQIIFGEALEMAPYAPCERAVQPWRDACAAKSCQPQPESLWE